MRIQPAIRSISTMRIEYNMVTYLRGNNPVTSYFTAFTLPSVSSNQYETILINKYRIEDKGFIEVFEINVGFVWACFNNGQWRWQVSGDGGNTWATITEASANDPTGITAYARGAGTWLSSIETGDDKFQVRLQARAIAGTVSTDIYEVRSGLGIDNGSYVVLNYRKKDRL